MEFYLVAKKVGAKWGFAVAAGLKLNGPDNIITKLLTPAKVLGLSEVSVILIDVHACIRMLSWLYLSYLSLS